MVEESGGPCIYWIKQGRGSRRYYIDGEEVGSGELERRLSRDPAERRAVLSAGRMRRAGWSLLAIGATLDVVGWATFIGLSVESSSPTLPVWGQALSGALIGSWFPTMAAGAVLTGEGTIGIYQAVQRVNARRECPEQ